MPLDEAERELDRRALASERTAMAWGRTALALTALGGVAVHAAAQLDAGALGYAFGVVLIGVAGLTALHGIRRYLAIQRNALAHWRVDPQVTRSISAATVTIALAAALLTVFG